MENGRVANRDDYVARVLRLGKCRFRTAMIRADLVNERDDG